MMTLISTHSNRGCTGRCDAKCYLAKTKRCTCCCGGMNHGAGLKKAMENTQRYAEKVIDRRKGEHPEDRVRIEPQQMELFA